MIDFHPVIVHIDMDAFFAAIEIRNNPNLRDKPVIVGGGIDKRGVVSTCSYEARKYGIHSGMPTATAKRLCPGAVFVASGLRGYVYASACLQKIFEKYAPVVEPVSIDEAFLDITGTEKIYGGPERLITLMKREIREIVGVTCSIGIAPGKYLAKLGSGLNKPDGVTVLDREEFKRIFFPRPVDSLWGVGESTKKSLNKRGIFTVGDLSKTDSKMLRAIFGKNGDSLSIMSKGIETSEVLRYRDMPHDKSMSHETTLREDLYDLDKIKGTVLWLSDRVGRRMRQGGYIGRTISVKIRSSDFNTITRAHTISKSTNRFDIIFNHAIRLIPKEYGLKIRVRLLGVRVSQLKRMYSDNEEGELNDKEYNYEDQQLELGLENQEFKTETLIQTVDSIRNKFGEKSIVRAGTLVQ